MSEPTNYGSPPPMPDTPPQPQSGTFHPGRKPFLMGVGVGAVVTALAALGIGLTVNDSGTGKHPKAAASTTKKAATEATDDTKETGEETGEDLYNPAPAPEDFTMKLKTTSKQCFGTAGCTVTVVPELSYDSPLPLDPGSTVSITYEIRGGEDGAVTETLDVTDSDQYEKSPTVLTTPSSGTKVTVKVTDVETY